MSLKKLDKTAIVIEVGNKSSSVQERQTICPKTTDSKCHWRSWIRQQSSLKLDYGGAEVIIFPQRNIGNKSSSVQERQTVIVIEVGLWRRRRYVRDKTLPTANNQQRLNYGGTWQQLLSLNLKGKKREESSAAFSLQHHSVSSYSYTHRLYYTYHEAATRNISSSNYFSWNSRKVRKFLKTRSGRILIINMK